MHRRLRIFGSKSFAEAVIQKDRSEICLLVKGFRDDEEQPYMRVAAAAPLPYKISIRHVGFALPGT
jgi:hypothetical protein